MPTIQLTIMVAGIVGWMGLAVVILRTNSTWIPPDKIKFRGRRCFLNELSTGIPSIEERYFYAVSNKLYVVPTCEWGSPVSVLVP